MIDIAMYSHGGAFMNPAFKEPCLMTDIPDINVEVDGLDDLQDRVYKFYDHPDQTEYWAFDFEKACRKFRNGVSSQLGMARLVSHWLDLRDARVLVIGSHLGSEAVAYALCGADVVGLDLDEDAVSIARRLAEIYGVEVTFESRDGSVTGFPDEYFDYVSCAQVLEHLPPDLQKPMLAEIWRVCKKGGLFWIDTPNQASPRDNHDTRLYFIHWLPRSVKVPLAKLFKRNVPTEEPGFKNAVVDLHHYLSYSGLHRILRSFGHVENLSVYRGYPTVAAYGAARRRQGRGDSPLFGVKLLLLRFIFSFWDYGWFSGIRTMFRKN